MNGESNAMIGDAVLWEVVSANLLAAVAAAHHRLPFFCQRLLLLLHLDLIQPRAQHPHAFLAVLDLRLLILATDDRVGRNMSDAHSRIRCIDRLPAGP